MGSMNTPTSNCSHSQGDFTRHCITAECEQQPVSKSHLCCWQKSGGGKKNNNNKGVGTLPHYELFSPPASLRLCLELGRECCRIRSLQLMWKARGRQFLFGNLVTDPDSVFVAHKAASFKTVCVNNCKFRHQLCFATA